MLITHNFKDINKEDFCEMNPLSVWVARFIKVQSNKNFEHVV